MTRQCRRTQRQRAQLRGSRLEPCRKADAGVRRIHALWAEQGCRLRRLRGSTLEKTPSQLRTSKHATGVHGVASLEPPQGKFRVWSIRRRGRVIARLEVLGRTSSDS